MEQCWWFMRNSAKSSTKNGMIDPFYCNENGMLSPFLLASWVGVLATAHVYVSQANDASQVPETVPQVLYSASARKVVVKTKQSA